MKVIGSLNSTTSPDSRAGRLPISEVRPSVLQYKRWSRTCWNCISVCAANTPADCELYQRQIDATDQQIDALVYELHGLTEQEIKIVEERTEPN